MKDPFKFQYKSSNLARLQDIFVNDTRQELKTNYTITNKSIKPDFELVTDKYNQCQTPHFIRKYNRVLNDFFTPSGNKYITVDLDEKLKLNYLHYQIDSVKNKKNQTYKSKLNEIKSNYILGSPIRSSKSEVNFDIPISPRSVSPTSRNERKQIQYDFIQGSNKFYANEN